MYLLCLFGTVAVRDKGYLGSCASILCVLLCAIVCEFSSVGDCGVCLVWVCGYLSYFGAVSPLLRGIDVRRVDCAIYYRSRICQRISIG